MTHRIEYTEEMVGNGHPTKADTLNRFINILTAQGDIPYATAAATAAALAKGAANLKMFMNAGATAPEWANGIKVGTFTRDMATASGDVGYTGVGFKPGLVILIAALNDVATLWSVGFSDGTTHGGMNQNYVPVMYIGTIPIYIRKASGDYQYAPTATMDADGFTLPWSKAGTPTGTIIVNYIALR